MINSCNRFGIISSIALCSAPMISIGSDFVSIKAPDLVLYDFKDSPKNHSDAYLVLVVWNSIQCMSLIVRGRKIVGV